MPDLVGRLADMPFGDPSAVHFAHNIRLDVLVTNVQTFR
jgi:hypothetical protein